MVLKHLAIFIYKKYCVAKYQKITINQFKSRHTDNVIIISASLDENVLNSITRIFELKKIKVLEIITTHSNLDKKFHTNWSGLAQLSGLNDIKLKVKVFETPISPDVYILSGREIYLIPKFSFESEITEVCVFNDTEEIVLIKNAFESAEEITHLRGNETYTRKFDKLFEISKRNFNTDESDKIINALIAWELSGCGYEDTEPLWRIFEEKIRKLIKTRLSQREPKYWFSKFFYNVLPPHKQKAIDISFNKVKSRLGLSTIDDHPNPIELVNPGDYEIVINNHKSDFSEFFVPNNIKFQYFLGDVVSARNDTIHPKSTGMSDLPSNTIIKTLILLEFFNQIEPSIK